MKTYFKYLKKYTNCKIPVWMSSGFFQDFFVFKNTEKSKVNRLDGCDDLVN